MRAAPRGPGADAQAPRVREMEGSVVSGFQLACAAGPPPLPTVAPTRVPTVHSLMFQLACAAGPLCEEPIEGAPARPPPRPAPPPAPPAREHSAPAPGVVPARGG